MNPIEVLENLVKERIIGVKTKVVAPEASSSFWTLEASLGPKAVHIAWHPGEGFGVSDVSEERRFFHDTVPGRFVPSEIPVLAFVLSVLH